MVNSSQPGFIHLCMPGTVLSIYMMLNKCQLEEGRKKGATGNSSNSKLDLLILSDWTSWIISKIPTIFCEGTSSWTLCMCFWQRLGAQDGNPVYASGIIPVKCSKPCARRERFLVGIYLLLDGGVFDWLLWVLNFLSYDLELGVTRVLGVLWSRRGSGESTQERT